MERKPNLALRRKIWRTHRQHRCAQVKRTLASLSKAILNPRQTLRRVRSAIAARRTRCARTLRRIRSAIAERRAKGARILESLREAARLGLTHSDQYIRRMFLGAVILMVVTTVVTAIAPLSFRFVVDELGVPSAGLLSTAIVGGLGAYALSQFIARVLTGARSLMHGYAQQRLQCHILLGLFAHIIRLPLRYHLSRKTGAVGETLAQGFNGFDRLINHALYSVLPVLVEFITIFIVLLSLHHASYLAIFSAAGVAYFIAFQYGATNIIGPAREASDAQVESRAVLTDSLLNCETIKYFDAEDAVCDRFDRTNQKTQIAWRIFHFRQAVNTAIVGSIFTASLVASLFIGAYEVTQGRMSVGDIVLINAYVLRFTQPLEILGNAVKDVFQGLAFLQKMQEILREKREVDSPQSGFTAANIRGDLQFKNVKLSYRPGRTILRDVSFTVPAGKILGIVGDSGSGKSSIVRALFRLWDIDSGEILLDGRPINSMPLSRLRRSISIVPQDLVLYNDTIRFNIAFGKWGASDEEVVRAAELAQIHDNIMSWPDGYDTIVGERGLKISGGERQRIAIARAAIKQPRIYVLDEATSALGSKDEREIWRNLLDVSRTCTMVVIAHRLSTLVDADEIAVLENGIIVERGSHDALRTKQGVYASMWKAQNTAAPSLVSES